ncbi:hypothetical protein BDZ94DRAFT_1367615 [Collybia nuda]|uniref:Uncharacterized protein n=1 Tax=Collybia nuda TaxID=64659 RepID=A0A9P6CJ04_9AGAR|nr:hypothetical protein BDZ94DRAFT_1367615 [Collybia nuda]
MGMGMVNAIPQLAVQHIPGIIVCCYRTGLIIVTSHVPYILLKQCQVMFQRSYYPMDTVLGPPGQYFIIPSGPMVARTTTGQILAALDSGLAASNAPTILTHSKYGVEPVLVPNDHVYWTSLAVIAHTLFDFTWSMPADLAPCSQECFLPTIEIPNLISSRAVNSVGHQHLVLTLYMVYIPKKKQMLYHLGPKLTQMLATKLISLNWEYG